MAVPDFQTLMRPLLEIVADGEIHNVADLRGALARYFELSEDDVAARIPSGRVTTLQNRVGWAATYLFRCGLLERPRRAHYRITERGRAVLAENDERVGLDVLAQFPEFHEFRARSGSPSQETATHTVADTSGAATPEEQLEAAHLELQVALADELLDRIRDQTWQFFEVLVLDVLRAMGYGGPRGSAEHLGASGDEGVDGVIREDALGLDLIYVQAKFWTRTVGRPEIQRFFGALHGQRATKGVFITTSTFSQEARDFAAGVTPRVTLIDGEELADLMIEHGVAIAVQHTYEVKRIDLDYFAGDVGADVG